ncbi:MAG: abortive infection family protein [Actinomycetota bacterium]|nr:abortive infection family protein [Actinomycetota bacterium]
MNLVALGSILGAFFEGGAGPTHDELDRAVTRAGLGAADPGPGGRTSDGTPIGKTKRIRQLFVFATDHDAKAGLALGRHVVDLLRADGMFEPTIETYAGEPKITRLQDVFANLGFDLDTAGALRPKVLDNLEGTALTEALQTLVARMNANPDDAALQVGTGKELDEAAARHVLVEKVGDYQVGGHAGSFPVTLANAFRVLDLEVPPDLSSHLSSDPHRQVQQCLFLLGLAINRLRNEAGSGHGRPDAPRRTVPLTGAEGRLVARATALLAGRLLDEL